MVSMDDVENSIGEMVRLHPGMWVENDKKGDLHKLWQIITRNSEKAFRFDDCETLSGIQYIHWIQRRFIRICKRYAAVGTGILDVLRDSVCLN
jgi:hypothetical protein